MSFVGISLIRALNYCLAVFKCFLPLLMVAHPHTAHSVDSQGMISETNQHLDALYYALLINIWKKFTWLEINRCYS